MKTIKQASHDSGISEKLIRSVIRQLGDKESLRDIANNSIDGGFHGFIYTADTVSFFKRNRSEIVALVENMAQDLGETALEMVAAFNCLGGREMVRQNLGYEADRKVTLENGRKLAEYFPSISRCLYGGRLTEDDNTVANALAWFTGEEVARAMCDE